MKSGSRALGLGWGLLCVAMGGSALAQELTEDFPDPLGGWNDRWLFQNSNLQSVYIAEGSDCDPDNRGNNTCGLWIADCRGCGCGIEPEISTIEFKPEFAATISRLEFEVSSFTPTRLTLMDKDGKVLLDVPEVEQTGDLCAGTQYSVDSDNGVGAIRFTCNDPCEGEGIEGNTAIDNIRVNGAGEPGCLYKLQRNSKAKKGCNTCPRKKDIYASGAECKVTRDCKKRIKIKKIDCPDGERGFCKKIKGKRDSCSA